MSDVAVRVVQPDEGRLGAFRILAMGAHTRNAYFALESRGRAVPLGEAHLHLDADEAEYVATGERVILVGDEELRASAGSFVLIPRGVAHDMADAPGTSSSRWFHLFSPPGIERWFEERERMRDGGASAEAISQASESYGVRTARRSRAPFHAVPADPANEHRPLASGGESAGAYTVVEHRLPPGRTIPAQLSHDLDEAFYVAEGELGLAFDGDEVPAPAGTFAFFPRGVRHGISTLREPARYIVIVSPARQR